MLQYNITRMRSAMHSATHASAECAQSFMPISRGLAHNAIASEQKTTEINWAANDVQLYPVETATVFNSGSLQFELPQNVRTFDFTASSGGGRWDDFGGLICTHAQLTQMLASEMEFAARMPRDAKRIAVS